VGELVDALGVSQPAVSKHLRILREAGLVRVRGDAQRRLYRVQAEPLRAVDDWLAPYRDMWPARLDDLERHLDTMPD
jgi:DNA-binding transcriptional ArsR family regulator